jgi:hypothetical protein
MVSTRAPEPIAIDPHYSKFYAELWGISEATVVRWFQDIAGVLKVSKQSSNGKRGASGIADSLLAGHAGLSRAYQVRVRMTAMLTLQRRHSQKCPQRNRGPNYLKCRGGCSLGRVAQQMAEGCGFR